MKGSNLYIRFSLTSLHSGLFKKFIHLSIILLERESFNWCVASLLTDVTEVTVNDPAEFVVEM